MAEEARGIRNKNPGNVRLSQAKWKGEVHPGTDKDFCQFSTMAYGVRCTAMVFLDYYHTHGLRDVAQMVGRWAPPVENATNAYAADVAARMGVTQTAKLDLTKAATLEALCEAVFYHENGAALVAASDIDNGVTLALDTYL